MTNFILAMAQYPEVLGKAQKEIDSIVGTGRLPDFSDRPHLPYGQPCYPFDLYPFNTKFSSQCCALRDLALDSPRPTQ